MRFIIYGAGAIGGAIGARLFEQGHEVVLIARGANLEAIRRDGLTVASPTSTDRFEITAVAHPSALEIRDTDVVILAMKTQDTAAALDALADVAAPSTSVVCAQNGVENERLALRRFSGVLGMCVVCPATYLEPGRVELLWAPSSGVLDLGRWPAGSDERAEAIAGALRAATFASVAREDISRWKWGKLVLNLGNAVEAACGHDGDAATLAELVRDEGVTCLHAAGIDFASAEEFASRRASLDLSGAPPTPSRAGGSTWQSLARGAGSVETDYLTGEVVLLGRLVGVPTPANDLLQDVARVLARARQSPGSVAAAELLERLGHRRGR